MAPTTTTINFKLHLAPGAVEKFSLDFQRRAFDEFVDNLELKLGELGLTFDVVFWKNEKGNLISLAQKVRKMIWTSEGKEHISLHVIPNSSADNSSDSSSGDSGDEEVVIVDAAPEEPRCRFGKRRHCGRRDRSRSRGFDRSRSRSHSRGRKEHHRGPRGPMGRCGRKRLCDLEQRVLLLEAQSAKRSRPCFGRRARSASPGGRPSADVPSFGRGFGPFGGHGPHGNHGHHGHHGHHEHHGFGPFGRGGLHGFGGRGGHHGFGRGGHHGFDPRTPFGFGGYGRF